MISSRTNGKDSGDRTADTVSRNTTEQVDNANASGRTPVVFVHVFARKSVGQIADHYAEVIGGLKKKPALIGHSFGGLITQTYE